MLIYSLLALFIILADQISKILISNNLTFTSEIRLIPGIINIVYLENTGAAFSMFSDHVEILGLISVLFCIGFAIYIYKKRPDSLMQKISFALIFSGAAGNAIDRVFRGYVIDFIETAFMDFPVFNIADIAITIGAVLLIIHVIFFDKT